MNVTPYFWQRNLTVQKGNSGNLRYSVSRMLWNVLGGCDQADIDVTGDADSLWSLPGMLRMGVELHGDYGYCWWGYVHEIVIHFPDHDVTFSMDRLFNRIAVAYNMVGAGAGDAGIAKITDYTTDALSIAEYGTKDLLLTADKMSDAAALRWRNVKIAEFAKPSGTPEPAANDTVSATIYCRGWWYSLEWRQALIDYTTSISYTANNDVHNVGDVEANNKVAQQVTVGGADISLARFQLYAKKVGDPVDDLRIAVYTVDGSGNPNGDSLFTSTIPAALITTDLAWIDFQGEEATLAASTMYSFVVDRVGGTDATNYYAVGVNTGAGYAGGVAKTWNYATWSAISPNADMNFKVDVNPLVAISTQVATLLSTYAEFLTLIRNETSTESQPSYMPGDVSVMQALEDFLEQGGASTRRVLAYVERNRGLHLYEEHAMPTRRFWQVKNGKAYTNGREAVPEDCQWILGRHVDIANAFVSATSYDTLQPQFVDSVEWTNTGGIQLRYKGKPAPEDEY